MATKIAVVTGASSGIGRAIALELARAGYAIAVVARNNSRLVAVEGELAEFGQPTCHVATDLHSDEATEAILGRVRDRLGEPTLLVNNAGTAPTAKFQKTSDAMLAETWQLHVRAPFRLIRALLPGMLERGDGTLVQIASSAGLRGFAFTSAYAAAKHAMVGMTRSLTLELGDTGLRTYAICPGFVDTEITRSAASAVAERGGKTVEEALEAMGKFNRIGRMHTTDEVAAAAIRICTERPDGCVYDLDADPPHFVD